MVEQIFLSPQVKWIMIISNKLVCSGCLTSCRQTTYGIFAGGGLSAHTRKKTRLSILGNQEISGKSKNFIKLLPGA